MTPSRLSPDAMASVLSPANHWGAVAAGKPAAVLLPLIPAPEGWRVLLIRRSMQVDVHRGQIGCPGGRRDPEDITPLATALRETEEELGVNPDQVRVLGGLPPHVTASTGFEIYPFVGILPPDLPMRPDPGEVADILYQPLACFLDPSRHELRPMTHAGTTLGVHYYQCGEDTIWGATAAILHLFADRLRAVLNGGGW